MNEQQQTLYDKLMTGAENFSMLTHPYCILGVYAEGKFMPTVVFAAELGLKLDITQELCMVNYGPKIYPTIWGDQTAYTATSQDAAEAFRRAVELSKEISQ